MQYIIIPAILEFFFYFLAYLNLKFFRNCGIAEMEKFMQVGTKKQAVIDAVRFRSLLIPE